MSHDQSMDCGDGPVWDTHSSHFIIYHDTGTCKHEMINTHGLTFLQEMYKKKRQKTLKLT